MSATCEKPKARSLWEVDHCCAGGGSCSATKLGFGGGRLGEGFNPIRNPLCIHPNRELEEIHVGSIDQFQPGKQRVASVICKGRSAMYKGRIYKGGQCQIQGV